MDFEPASDGTETGPGRFVGDLALCLAVHRDRSPAIVWPEGSDDLVADANGELPDLAGPLGALLGCEVTRSTVALPVGGRRTGDTVATDLVLLPVSGSCRCEVERRPPSGAPPHRNTS